MHGATETPLPSSGPWPLHLGMPTSPRTPAYAPPPWGHTCTSRHTNTARWRGDGHNWPGWRRSDWLQWRRSVSKFVATITERPLPGRSPNKPGIRDGRMSRWGRGTPPTWICTFSPDPLLSVFLDGKCSHIYEFPGNDQSVKLTPSQECKVYSEPIVWSLLQANNRELLRA